LAGNGQFAQVMISTQLDLFGGPPKPPKNIREEEPNVVAEPLPEKAEEPVHAPDPGIQDSPSEELVLDVVPENTDEDLPEWIDAFPEQETEAIEEPAYETYPDELDESLVEVVPGVEEGQEPEPVATDEQEFVAATASEEEHDNESDAEITETASIAQDTVHVQLPSHDISPVVFTSLTPVEGFLAEDEQIAEMDELKPEMDEGWEENEKDLPELEDDNNTLVLQDEEPPSPPFIVEAMTTDDEVIGGEPATEGEDVHAENANETKEGQLQIPEDEKLFLRQYYTMRETSAMFGVNQSLLRYWENEFDVLKPKKNRKGDRYFRPEDIKNLELIYHLLKVRKFTIEGAREYIKSKKKVLDTFELVQRLEKLKLFLHELKTHL
jgi:DNA-binding transcriptional MerR regulator